MVGSRSTHLGWFGTLVSMLCDVSMLRPQQSGLAAQTAESPSEVLDRRDDPIRRYETYYQYARDAYERAHTAWGAADEKAEKALILLALLLGVTALGVETFVKAILRRSGADIVFMAASVTYAVAALAAIWRLLDAIRLRHIKLPPTTEQMTKHFNEHDYIDVLFSVGRKHMEVATAMDMVVHQKFRAVGHALYLMQAMLICLVIAATSFMFLKIEDTMTEQEKPSSQPTDSVPRKPATRDSPKPRPGIQSPDFGSTWRNIRPDPKIIAPDFDSRE